MVTKEIGYSGTVKPFKMFKWSKQEKEYVEVIDGNTRHQEETGGLVFTYAFDVAGEEVEVSKVVTAAQVASLTHAQTLAAAGQLLAAKLGLKG